MENPALDFLISKTIFHPVDIRTLSVLLFHWFMVFWRVRSRVLCTQANNSPFVQVKSCSAHDLPPGLNGQMAEAGHTQVRRQQWDTGQPEAKRIYYQRSERYWIRQVKNHRRPDPNPHQWLLMIFSFLYIGTNYKATTLLAWYGFGA